MIIIQSIQSSSCGLADGLEGTRREAVRKADEVADDKNSLQTRVAQQNAFSSMNGQVRQTKVTQN
jgi:hypothetical protein